MSAPLAPVGSDAEAAPPLLVACLCAQWCGSCLGYRAVFEALQAQAPAGTRFRWVDIEDEAALVGPVDAENFPTLLIARGGAVCFFGPVTPHAATARALIERAHAGALPPLAGDAPHAELHALARRLAG